MSKTSKLNLFRNKDFLLLFLGELVSRVGSNVHYVALTWFVLDTTGSGTTTGTLLFFSTLPGVILSPFSGVIADRINRKFLIVGMDIIRGLIVLWLSYLVYTSTATFAHLIIATILIAISSSFFDPAIAATFPNIVADKDLQQANSWRHFNMQFTAIIGAALGGFLISILGVAGVFLINGVSYLLSALSELFINIPKVEKSSSKSTLLDDLKFGFQYLYNNQALFSLFSISIIINFLAVGVMAVGIPYIFKEVLQVNSRLYGISQGIFPLGALIGALLLGFLPEIKNYFKTLALTISLQTIMLFSIGLPILPGLFQQFSLFTIYITLLGILLFFGIFNALGNVPVNVLLQRIIPDAIRGRVFGLITTFNMALTPISMALIGWLLDIFPSHLLFLSCGTIMALVLILAFIKMPALKTIDNYARENKAIS